MGQQRIANLRKNTICYDTLTKELDKEKGSLIYIGEDFNARLYGRLKEEEEVIEPYL